MGDESLRWWVGRVVNPPECRFDFLRRIAERGVVGEAGVTV